MNSILDRFIGNLDTLIPFVALSRRDVFDMLHEHRRAWFQSPQQLPQAFNTYKKYIVHSSFLLGYAYFEGFLNELLAEVLRNRPSMMSQDKKLGYREILSCDSKEEILERMVQRELIGVFYMKMSDIVSQLRERYNFNISESEEQHLVNASFIRNCLVHNSARADARLASVTELSEGQEIEFSELDVHDYGIKARALARRMYDEARKNHAVDS